VASRPGTFDVSQFLSPFRGDPIGAQKLQTSVWSDAAQNALQAGQLAQQMKRAKAQQELERQAIGQRASTAYMQQEHADSRKKAELAQAAELARQKLAREQELKGGELAGEASKAFAAGDLNALAGIQARAQMLDPMLRMTLPGQAPQPRVDPNLPSVDEAYPLEKDALTIERGGKQLYSETQDVARQREQDVIGRMISPMRSSPFAADYAPSFESGMNLAGRGMTGADAAAWAQKQGNAESDRIARMRGQDLMSGATKHRMGIQDATLQLRLDDQIDQIQSQVQAQFGVNKNQQAIDALGKLQSDIASGIPFQQNKAMLELLKESIRGAGSDKDMAAMDNAAGFWNSLERNVDRVLAGGELPAEFQQQVQTALQAAQLAAERKKNKAALGLRDAIYNSPLLPLSDEQRVMIAADRYGRLTGRQLPPEAIQAELQRRRGAGPARGLAEPPATSRSISLESSSSDGLGVTGNRPPRIPVTPDFDVNAEADALLEEEED
jgi:hypothetical protein